METEIRRTLLTPDTELTDKVIYAKQSTNPFSTWMELVSKISAELNKASDLDELRNKFRSIVEDIESKIDAQYSNPQASQDPF